MTFRVLTLFPDMIREATGHSIIGRAVASGKVEILPINIRDFAVNKHGQVDDAPYGGGAGMVMMAQPVYDALSTKSSKANAPVIYLSPQGKVLTQKKAAELSLLPEITLICGHYEGLDERLIEEVVTEEISIGDYVLTGGEPAAIVLIDAVSRLIPGVLGKEESHQNESFSSEALLEHPHYTRPPVWQGREVPEILLSGHHGNIDKWRKEQSIARTRAKRPDLPG
jgi:tRNA (guanine37-N1)-methyltransferase